MKKESSNQKNIVTSTQKVHGHWEFVSNEGKGTIDFNVSVQCGKAEIHLPLSLGEDEEFQGEKMDVFEIDDEILQLNDEKSEQPIWVKGGVYPVYVRDGHYVIPVEIN